MQLPSGVTASDVKIAVGTTDVTSKFSLRGGALVGLVTSLPVGESTVTATTSAGLPGITVVLATAKVTNHDRNGPIISGPQQTPFICQTAEFRLPDGSMLGASQDPNCNAPTNVMYVYKAGNVAGFLGFKPYNPAGPLPADMSKTTTSDGRTVNYILRVETGTINRAIYQFSVLYDPATEPAPSPLTSYQGWNRKIVYIFGGNAASGYIQGAHWLADTSSTLGHPAYSEDDKLSAGFAVLGSTLNVFGNAENDVLSAETVSMVKEKFIKTFGAPIYTMGWGGSGGSMQQHLIANNYPGLLDGLTPTSSFPDLHTLVMSGADCYLMDRAINASGLTWTDAQKTAASGYNTWSTCTSFAAQNFAPGWMQATRTSGLALNLGFGLVVDTNNCSLSIPANLLYDPVSNKTGARCDVYSATKNLFGVDPATGYAARAYDNVGVLYGLAAFQSGAITGDQFVALNELVGGYDSDGNLQSQRTTGNATALNNLYEFGRINDGSNLGAIPIFDYRTDAELTGNVHDNVRTMTTRARIARSSGTSENHVVWRGTATTSGTFIPTALSKMDEWLTNIAKDTHSYPSQAAKAAANKPAGLVDTCFPAAGPPIQEVADPNNGGQCGAVLPYYRDPRMVAGGPLTDDILKCQLKPLVRGDFSTLSDAQFARLSSVFSDGVCDYSKPGVGMKPLKGMWLSYPSPGVAVPLQ
jgi:hypothetical protein